MLDVTYEDLDALDAAQVTFNYDGDTVELDNGWSVTFRAESDQMPVMDGWSDECYGKVAEVTTSRYDVYENPRSDGFDGNAEKIATRDYSVWWQPPSDGPKRGTREFRAERQLVRDLLEYGFSYWYLIVKDEDGNEIVGHGMGGIEPVQPNDEYGASIVADLWAECVYEIVNREARAARELVRVLVNA